VGGLRTVGVEEELMLFTAGSDRVAPAGETLAEQPDVEHEFKLEQAEIASEPTQDLAGLAADLRARRRELIEAARERGVTVTALGTSPAPARSTLTPDDRYRRMHEQYGLVGREQLTCGTHVHVSVASRAEGVAAIDGARPWHAVLLALSANSPFWDGADTGYASYRTVSWGRGPTAGPTMRFGGEATYDRVVAALIASGAALDPGMIYFDARLSARYSTVEFRVADVGQHVADSVLTAALCRALVDTALHYAAADPPVAVLRSAAWRAARYGMSGELFDVVDGRLRPAADVVDHLLDSLAPALRAAGDADVVHAEVQRVLRRGTGAELQRADLARRGQPRDVVAAAAARTASS
jgi:carboxylate-amine ligase